MTVTVHVLYPISDGVTFNHDYFAETHLPLVRQHFSPHGLIDVTASKGLAGGADTPPSYFAITTMLFPDQASVHAALGAAEPVLADVLNYTNCHPEVLIGSVMA
jgi:uncharacterized protein (TIGR02118 family)